MYKGFCVFSFLQLPMRIDVSHDFVKLLGLLFMRASTLTKPTGFLNPLYSIWIGFVLSVCFFFITCIRR